MKRILLFLATNIAVLVVFNIPMQLLGIDSLLDKQGGGLNLNSLIIYASITGFTGSFISMVLSKWTAKLLTSAGIIEHPANETENWLVKTVRRQARQAQYRSARDCNL